MTVRQQLSSEHVVDPLEVRVLVVSFSLRLFLSLSVGVFLIEHVCE